MFLLKSQLPIETQVEIDRIQAIPAGERTAEEAAWLAALNQGYLYNTVEQYDANGNILHCTGFTIPVNGQAGFAKGCTFVLLTDIEETDVDENFSIVYENRLSSNYCAFLPINQMNGENGTPTDGATYGRRGQMFHDDDYLYICTVGSVGVGGATWKKIALTAMT